MGQIRLTSEQDRWLTQWLRDNEAAIRAAGNTSHEVAIAASERLAFQVTAGNVLSRMGPRATCPVRHEWPASQPARDGRATNAKLNLLMRQVEGIRAELGAKKVEGWP